MSNTGPKLAGLHSISVSEFEDGTNTATYWRLDMTTRRMIPLNLGGVDQPARTPFAPHELLVMAALENSALELYGQPALR